MTRSRRRLGPPCWPTPPSGRHCAGSPSRAWFEAEHHGRLARYVLTDQGRRRLEEAADRIYLRRELAWDGHWRVLTYSFPERVTRCVAS